ncbi:MAG: response regulator transcription factor [Bacteroidota bacterium]
MPIKLLIYEDNSRLRQSLELLLGEGSGFEAVGAFPDCDQAAEQADILKPELVVMDIDMPGIGGIEGTKIIKARFPDVKVIMHTVFDDDSRIFECICAGADGYLLKNTPPLKLIQSLIELSEGGAPMSPFVAQKVFQHFRKEAVLKASFQLTKREQEILEWLVKGNSYKMIADKSSISIDTVKKHLQNIYHKLHVNCGTEAVAKALQYKIVDVM